MNQRIKYPLHQHTHTLFLSRIFLLPEAMNDLTIQIQMLAKKFHRFVLDCEPKQSSIADHSDNVSKQEKENADSMDEHSLSNGIHEVSPDKGHTLPILRKIIDTSTKIQDLKKQHVALSDEVKLTIESFPGPDILKSVQLLGSEYELLKRKYSEESSERKQMAEKLKQEEKETKKLQDRLAAREHHCRKQDEKVRDLENQIAEKRKTRLKQESKSLAVISAQPSSIQQTNAHKTMTDKEPPLNPSKLRLPLRRITNSLPPPSPLTSKTYTTAFINGKENSARRNSMATNIEVFGKPRRRASIAEIPPPVPSSSQIFQARRRISSIAMRQPASVSSTTQVLQPRRRVSIATVERIS